MGRKKVLKTPAKKMSFEVSKNGVLTDKLSNIKQLMELMRGDEISKDNRYYMDPKEKVLQALKAMEATAPFTNPKLKNDKKLDKRWEAKESPEYFGSTWKDIKAFAERYEISNEEIMKYMASKVIDRTKKSTIGLAAQLKALKLKKFKREGIIQNAEKFIKKDIKLKKKKNESDRDWQERLYQVVYKAEQRVKK